MGFNGLVYSVLVEVCLRTYEKIVNQKFGRMEKVV